MLNVTRIEDIETILYTIVQKKKSVHWYGAYNVQIAQISQIMQHSYWTDGHQPELSLVFHKYRLMWWMITDKWTETVAKLRVVYYGTGGDGSK